jgi:3-deoxy-manno-octulosonate cytidylyltransferase (CMP-KDO synthetase)
LLGAAAFVPTDKVLGVIPARLGAERLPGKPLRLLGGQPLILRVALNAQASGALDEIVVASDADEVLDVVGRAGFRGVKTRGDHASGTSRVGEVAALPEFAGCAVVVNVQGDEPFLPAEAIRGAVGEVVRGWDVGTAAAPLDAAEAASPHVVKVVLDEMGRALYFSRALVPHDRSGTGAVRYWQHLGVYAYRPSALALWLTLPATEPEAAEQLEQLRALGNGMSIGVARIQARAMPGIDTPDDLGRAEAHLAARGEPITG